MVSLEDKNLLLKVLVEYQESLQTALKDLDKKMKLSYMPTMSDKHKEYKKLNKQLNHLIGKINLL